MRRVLLALSLAAATSVSSIAQTPTPEPVYDVSFVLTDGQVYTGTTTFVVDAKGVVTGQMTLTQPTPVASTLAGSLKDAVWTFKYNYSATEQACAGSVTGTAKVPTDRKLISGNAIITGCSEEPLAAVFTFTLKPKKD